MDSQNTSSEDMMQSKNKPYLNHQRKQKAAYSRNWRCPSRKTVIVCFFIFLIIVIVVVALPVSLCPSKCVPIGPACPHNWVGFQGNCYYFSKEERNWTSSWSFCKSQQASLARIESEQKDFISLLNLKNTFWIGLNRTPGQSWRWPNGQKATLPVLGDGGDCAYLNDEAKASSSRCSTEHNWMCSKADALQNPK